jgi:integrase
VQIRVNGHSVAESSKSNKKADAITLRDKLLSRRVRGELAGGTPDRILIGELLDDVLLSDIKESTRYIWTKLVAKNIRPFFGRIKAVNLTTAKMNDYRKKRIAEGVVDSTANRELSILRTAFHNARKVTPPKVHVVPYFPMKKETTVRQGFVADDAYARLRDELPQELKALFVTYYISGVRKSELLDIEWPQVDFEADSILLEKGDTKTDDPRTIPILPGDHRNLLLALWEERQANWPESPWVFSRCGEQIKDFRGAWKDARARAGLPDLLVHDLRRTAVRNMRRAGVPQVMRMKISGHKTDSMERRYDIAGEEGLPIARDLMARRMNGGDGVDIAKELEEISEFRRAAAEKKATH